MLQENPYGFDPSNPSAGSGGSQESNNLSSGAAPPTPPSSGGFDGVGSVGGYVPPQPPPVINPLNDLNNAASAEAPDYTSSIPPALSPESGNAQQDTGRKAPNKKILIVLVFVLLLLGIIGGGAFALMSGLIKNPFGGDTTPAPVVTPPPAEPTAPPAEPQPVPEPPPIPEPPPVQSNDDMRVTDLNILATGLNSYGVSYSNAYPSTGDQLIHVGVTNTPCFELLAENLIPSCPSDPAGDSAFYGYKSNGVSYEVTAKLDDSTCTRSGAIITGSICLYSIKGGSITQP